MPYNYPGSVPDYIKGLPAEAQKLFVAAFNAVLDKEHDEEKARIRLPRDANAKLDVLDAVALGLFHLKKENEMTYTYAILKVSKATFEEIKEGLKNSGHKDAIIEGVTLDMNGATIDFDNGAYQILIEGTEYKFETVVNPTSVLPQYIIMARIESSTGFKRGNYTTLFSSEKENYESFQMMKDFYEYLHEERIKNKRLDRKI